MADGKDLLFAGDGGGSSRSIPADANPRMVVHADLLSDHAEYRDLSGPMPTLSVQKSLDHSEASYQAMSMGMPIPMATNGASFKRDVSRELSGLFPGDAEVVDTSVPMARSLDFMDAPQRAPAAAMMSMSLGGHDMHDMAGSSMVGLQGALAADEGSGRRIGRTDSEISMSFSMDQGAEVFNSLNIGAGLKGALGGGGGAAAFNFSKDMFRTPDEAHDLRVDSSPLQQPVPSRPAPAPAGALDMNVAEALMAADDIMDGAEGWGLLPEAAVPEAAVPAAVSSYSTPFVESAGDVEVMSVLGAAAAAGSAGSAAGVDGVKKAGEEEGEKELELKAAELSQVLQDMAARDAMSPSPVGGFRVTSESFEGQDQIVEAGPNGLTVDVGGGRQARCTSYEATIDGVWELDHVRVKVALSPSPRGSDASSDVSSQRIFGATGAFEAFNDRFAEALQRRVRVARGLRRSGAQSAPPAVHAQQAADGEGSEEGGDIAVLARIAAMATPAQGGEDAFDAAAMANEPAAEAAARSLCKLLYKTGHARTVAQSEGLSGAVFGLLRSGSPQVVEYAIVASSLVLGQVDTLRQQEDASNVLAAIRSASGSEAVRKTLERAASNAKKAMQEEAAAAAAAAPMPTPTGLLEQLSGEGLAPPPPRRSRHGASSTAQDLLQAEISFCAQQVLAVVA